MISSGAFWRNEFLANYFGATRLDQTARVIRACAPFFPTGQLELEIDHAALFVYVLCSTLSPGEGAKAILRAREVVRRDPLRTNWIEDDAIECFARYLEDKEKLEVLDHIEVDVRTGDVKEYLKNGTINVLLSPESEDTPNQVKVHLVTKIYPDLLAEIHDIIFQNI